MKVLIVKLSSLGDVVHTLPALGLLRSRLGPSARIDWLVEEGAAGIVEGHPLVDEVLVVKNRGWLREPAATLAVAGRLRERRYDVVVDFQGLAKSAVWVALSGATRRIGFAKARELSHLALTERLGGLDSDMHAVDRYLRLAAMVSPADGELRARFPLEVDNDAAARAAELLESSGLSAQTPFMVLIPGARWPTKLWSEERFAEVARRAADELGLGSVVVGAAADRPKGRAIVEMAGRKGVADLTGRTTLKELAALCAMAQAAVSVDSGPMHVAAAAETAVVALFGPTSAKRTGPYGGGHVVVRSGAHCSPCFKKHCADPFCMRRIDAEGVMEAVRTVLRGRTLDAGGRDSAPRPAGPGRGGFE
ncbi:MAG TPA: lipopolysaccharide heptosyltransferase II [Deltaproteobacteria bacterium]|nr:lipopolysaccharide heptosyltransferase II [Deltaproteobacteria bacterium]